MFEPQISEPRALTWSSVPASAPIAPAQTSAAAANRDNSFIGRTPETAEGIVCRRGARRKRPVERPNNSVYRWNESIKELRGTLVEPIRSACPASPGDEWALRAPSRPCRVRDWRVTQLRLSLSLADA